ncbi:NERD domain-containing protein [Actinocrinis puniceicyclus]|uniref:NERD domain-containing protein n=1 Tax=Actinocrinis puniceicyclus TaxID=977794 RepID=A0A8J7WJ65_9ACTN|nr:nuclease-related domain-containing protein [Actinocrinis puniceicyclus]MBS2963268.1 NERD domain-containing protein [Actinocrinis puniceicyclus]
MATIGRAARREGPPRAGQSLQIAYSQRYSAWISNRRRSAALSALWWGPAIVGVSIVAGYSTHFPFFGALYFVLAFAVVLDVLFRKPDALVRVRARAAAESETGKALRAVEIRGRAIVLHDRMLTRVTEPFEVEHLVLSPRGAFLIDSKQWQNRDVRMFGTKIYVDHEDRAPMFKRLVEQARALGEALTEAAAHDEEVGIVTVQPVLAVHMENLPGTPRNMLGVTVVTPPQLAPMLRSPDVRWSAPAVRSLADAADRLLLSKDPARAG